MGWARSVILESAAAEFLDESADRLPRLKDVLQALEWRLARQPEIGTPVSSFSPLRYLVKSEDWGVFPFRLTLLYPFTDEEVIIEFADIEEV